MPESDHCTLLNVFLQWERNGRSNEWCDRHFIHGRALRRASEVHKQLKDILEAQRLPYTSCDGRWDSAEGHLQRVLLTAEGLKASESM